MNRKILVILAVFVLLTLNICAAQEMENATVDDVVSTPLDSEELDVSNDTQVLEVYDGAQVLKASESTKFTVVSKTDFDVIGDYFKVKLTDMNNNSLKNIKVTFTVNGKNYNINTDASGIASLQLRLNDGSYDIVTKFAGNSKYKASSLTTKITMDNTREIESGMSNSEIQNIINNAKANNVILFKGSTYSNINLVITKSLTLQSNVNTVLKSSSGPVITIKGKSASLTTVKGFDIRSGGDGIVISDSDYVKIIKNDISGNGNGIVATGTKYLNITKNDITKNSKSGISIAKSSYSYIFNNKINSNGVNAIELAKSNNIYIHGNTLSQNNGNGIYLAKKINGVDYGSAAYNVYINNNTISKNKNDGILMYYAGENVNIKSNVIESNKENGISMAHVGSNTIQSNIISDNRIGIKFFDYYVKPAYQDISYNAVVANHNKEMEAKETYFQENGVRLDVGDNWYSDLNSMCPKIKSGKIKFTVKQIGPNLFQATFLDSNGNVASLLPDRTLTYNSNGKTYTISIVGGAGTFTVDADDGDMVKATVDMSHRYNTYDTNSESAKPINGAHQTFVYPTIPNYQIYEDIGGNGNGNGDGSGGNANRGNGVSTQDSNSNGNSTYSQNMDPANNPNNQVSDVSQNYASDSVSQAGASESSAGNSEIPGSKSVLKQILMDDDEFFRITGMSFIVLLIILTVGFYYREDIKEMNSKR